MHAGRTGHVWVSLLLSKDSLVMSNVCKFCTFFVCLQEIN